MDPKDLKNSEELKRTLPLEPEQPDDAVDTTGQSSQKEKEKSQEKTEVIPDAPLVIKPSAQSEKSSEEAIKNDTGPEKVEEPGEVQPVQEDKKPVNNDTEKTADINPDEKTASQQDAPETAQKSKDAPKKKAVKSKKPATEVGKAKTDISADAEKKPKTGSKKKLKATTENPEEAKTKVAGKEGGDEVKTEEVEKKPKAKKKTKAAAKEQDVEEKETKPKARLRTKKASQEPEKVNIVSDSEETKKEAVAEATEESPEAEEAGEKPGKAAENKGVEKEEVDYASMTQVELINILRDLLEKNNGEDIKRQIETIKSQFYRLLNKKREEAKKKFLEEGGDEEDFVVEDDLYEQDIKDLLKKYRHLRIEFNKKQESLKEDNLEMKYQVIEEIKNLINREESINKTFQEFRDLQARWREIGLVPQSKMKDLWETYHFHVENFYNYIKINKELRDLDLKKNLETKITLCERAEELLLESSILKAFNLLQKLHERWREIGPVPRDKKDEIWERFKTATAKINKKHQDYFESRKTDQKKNLDAKRALCEKAEEIADTEIRSHRDWDIKSRELVELQKVWRTIGFAPKRDNNKIYDRFRIACDKFFDNRREFYAKNKELKQNNLQMKIDLCVQAESLKDSTDWKKTTQDFVNIQRKWKEIGPVPRKHSDQIWKRFRAACDFFFEMKAKHFSDIDEEQIDNLKLKEDLIKEVESYQVTKEVAEDLKKLKDFQRRWTEIGHVPIRQKDSILNKFRDAINKHFDDLKLDEPKRDILKFRNKVSNFTETSRGKNKMRVERDKYMSKLKQLENDLVLLDNNIGFFTQSKNAESLIADVNEKIERTKEKIELLKKKIRIIDEFDSDNE